MTFLNMDQRSPRPLSRTSYQSVVRAGLTTKNYRFAREAAIAWLATFPGDLSMGLLYAKTLIGEERYIQALPVLQGLCMADVENVEAAGELFQLQDALFQKKLVAPNDLTGERDPGRLHWKHIFTPGLAVEAYLYALGGEAQDEQKLPSWSTDLRLARYYLSQNQLDQAEQMIRQVLGLQVLHPLIAVTHLRYLHANREVSNLESRQRSAARYAKTWPDCLACSLYYADWMLEHGDSTEAVALLHQTAARDVGGQVPRRIWGETHPYLPLWPEQMQLEIGQAVPADIAQVLGWNRLPDLVGGQRSEQDENLINPLPWEVQPDDLTEPGMEKVFDEFVKYDDQEQSGQPLEQIFDMSFLEQGHSDDQPEMPEMANSLPAQEQDKESEAIPSVDAVIQPSLQTSQDAPEALETEAQVEDLLPLKQELERMAKRLRLPGIARQDGRFPVYVILSLRKNLERQYGNQATYAILGEMERLAATVRHRKRWDARVFLADDPGNLANLEMAAIGSNTAWNVKLALADLDQALAKRGEMIGAVLIAGGPEIVPFHALPNPVDDQDADVPSDNPYGARDENYFMPEWPVGRLPIGSGSDASLLIALLRRITKYHLGYSHARPWRRRLSNWLWGNNRRRKSSFGYTAAVWRNAAENVFRPIGEPRSLNSSPPLGLNGAVIEAMGKSNKTRRIPKPKASLAYFNLHGMENTPEWYGQRDPLDPLGGPDYLVALRPQDIGTKARFGKKAPQVVFSEACYGLHIYGRSVDDAIALKFLEAGSLAVVGSTVMAYGSIDTPLVAADLLGYAFWKAYQEGLPVGEALRQAKIHLAKEMNSRQGYLDGEDQKTIISFVLYGDPLASREIPLAQHKSIWRNAESAPQPVTVCDRSEGTDNSQDIPTEVLDSVRQVVSQYLPGMANAQMAYAVQRKACKGEGHSCPTSKLGQFESTVNSGSPAQYKSAVGETSEGNAGVRRLVTLSKQIPNTHGIHAQVARLTLDEKGALVKLVVSR